MTAEKILHKIEGAEYVLSVLLERGTIREKESEILIKPLYEELVKIAGDDILKQPIKQNE